MANASTGETYDGEWHEGKRHGEGKGHHASSGVDYVGTYVNDDPSSIPDNCDVEVVPPRPPRGDDEPEPELDEGEDPPAWGSEKDPMRVTQGEGVPGPLRLTVRLAYVPPPPPTPPPEEEPTNEKEESGEEGGEEEAPGDGDEETERTDRTAKVWRGRFTRVRPALPMFPSRRRPDGRGD